MKISLIYTGTALIPVMSKKIKEVVPDSEIVNILDDSLIADCIREGQMIKSTAYRIQKLYQYAYELGSDYIINTCSSVGETVSVANEILSVPILRIDDPMAEEAIEKYSHIGVVATLNSTLEPTCNLLMKSAEKKDKSITIEKGLAKGAYEALCNNNSEIHNNLILNAAKQISSKCDVIVLSQGSMACMTEKIHSVTNLPVLSSPDLFVEHFKKLIMQ